jgi:lipocalin
MHYQAYRRLRELRKVIITVVEDDEKRPMKESQVITGDAKAKEKAKKMVKVIKNLRFWDALSRYVVSGKCEQYLTSYLLHAGWNNTWSLSRSLRMSPRRHIAASIRSF